MATMQAVEITRPGAADVLQLTERAIPRPGPGEVLIRVAAAGVNRPDVSQRQGNYAPPPGASDLPGLEVAGELIEGDMSGDNPFGLERGDLVCALLTGGGYAEYAVAPLLQCLPIPGDLSLLEAAALPENYFTVWSNVFDRGRLGTGADGKPESLLVQGGSSGIGVTAIQLAHALGHRVFATAGNPEKCAACEKLGAHAINYREQDFVEEVKKHTDGRGVDVILDMVAGRLRRRSGADATAARFAAGRSGVVAQQAEKPGGSAAQHGEPAGAGACRTDRSAPPVGTVAGSPSRQRVTVADRGRQPARRGDASGAVRAYRQD